MEEIVVRPRQVKAEEEVKPVEKVKLYPYEPSDWELRVIEKVEKTHPQLSPMLLWNLCSVFARYGNVNIAIRGCGKSAILKSIMNHVHNIVHIWVDAGFTPVYIANSDLVPIFETKPVEMEVDDFCSFLATTRETLLHTFMFISQITYNKCYFGRVKGHPTITRSDVGTIGSGTYDFAKDAMILNMWTGNIQDRFTRYYHFYYDHPTEIEDLPKIEENPPEIPDVSYSPLPSMGDETNVELFKAVWEMFRTQMTDARAMIVARKMLQAHAYLCGRDVVTDEDCKFLLLFRPFISIESNFVSRQVLEDGEVSQSRGLFFNDIAPEILFYISYQPISIQEIAKRTNYREKVIRTTLNKLRRAGYVREEDGKWYISGIFEEYLKHVYSCLGVYK